MVCASPACTWDTGQQVAQNRCVYARFTRKAVFPLHVHNGHPRWSPLQPRSCVLATVTAASGATGALAQVHLIASSDHAMTPLLWDAADAARFRYVVSQPHDTQPCMVY